MKKTGWLQFNERQFSSKFILVYSDVYFIDENVLKKSPKAFLPSGITPGRTTARMIYLDGVEWVYRGGRFWDVDPTEYTVYYDKFDDSASNIGKRVR